MIEGLVFVWLFGEPRPIYSVTNPLPQCTSGLAELPCRYRETGFETIDECLGQMSLVNDLHSSVLARNHSNLATRYLCIRKVEESES